MAVLSDVKIWNLAMNLLGEPPIVTLGQDDQAGEVGELVFDDTRQAVLRDHTWNFAKRRATLARLATAPAFGFSYQYALPSDWLRNIRVNDGREPFSVESANSGQRVILSNSSSIELRYVADITDPTKYEPLFTAALVARLAAENAFPLTKDTALENRMWERYKDKLSDAKAVNGQDGPIETIIADEFIDARVAGFGEPFFRAIESS